MMRMWNIITTVITIVCGRESVINLVHVYSEQAPMHASSGTLK